MTTASRDTAATAHSVVHATLVSVSLMTVEFAPARGGTRLVFTEQGAFLDGHDTAAEREHGTRVGLDRLTEELERAVRQA